MGKNEIRLRRQQMSSGRIAHHRNYDEVLSRHERHLKMKRLMRILIYILITVVLVVIFLSFFLVRRLEQQKREPGNTTSSVVYNQGKN